MAAGRPAACRRTPPAGRGRTTRGRVGPWAARPSGKLDLAAPGRCGAGPDTAADLRHHDARSRLAAQLACLVDGLLERHLDAVGELAESLGQRLGLDLEAERQHARS